MATHDCNNPYSKDYNTPFCVGVRGNNNKFDEDIKMQGPSSSQREYDLKLDYAEYLARQRGSR